MKRLFFVSIMIFSLVGMVSAQEIFERPPESGDAFALSVSDTGIQLGAINQAFGGTIDVDFNPADPRRWARVDNFGILRFVDLGNPEIVEGTYTFSPFFDGFEAPSPEENKIFVRDVEWSPDGRMLAFYIENESLPDLAQGLWFWQPLMELSTDPAYQLLRPCPGYCNQAGVAANYAGWDVLNFEWSSDNSAILIAVNAYDYGGRRALMLKFAQRSADPPAVLEPTFLLYDYGHWSNNGQQIIVSGRDADDNVIFGRVDRTAANPIVTLASDIGMVWVQDAVQLSDDALVMLGSLVSETAPLQLIDDDGNPLTPPIGERAPDAVAWSPDNTAVRLHIGDAVYVASVDGTVYEITALLNGSPNIAWVNGALPANFTVMPLPEPLAEGEVIVEETPTPDSVTPINPTSRPLTSFSTGDLLVVTQGMIQVYNEPGDTGVIIGTLESGDELIITAEPLTAGNVRWYRVQSLDFTGWINQISPLAYPDD